MLEERSLMRVKGQILNRPIAVSEEWAAVIIAAVRSELNIALLEDSDGQRYNARQLDALASRARSAADSRRARRTEEKIYPEAAGIAIIKVEGTLTRSWGLDPYSGFTGYDGIKAKLIAAMDDDDVRGILFDIDSPGGAVAGCFDLTDLIFACNERNGGKPIWGIANELACSAAYSVLSACDERFVTRTAEVGSVGVLWIYTNIQKAMEMDGVEATIFRAGKHKAEGNSLEKMGKDTAERIQGTLDEMRDLFIDTVSRNLGKSTAEVKALKKTVRETEALTYIGQHARDIGFASAIASEDQVWTRFMDHIG